MIKVWFFLWKYKILKNPINLSYQTASFLKLSFKNQKMVLDKYFSCFKDVDGLATYFDSKESRCYVDGKEVTFFHNYYFDEKLIYYDVRNIIYIDKFMIDEVDINKLIEIALKNSSSSKKQLHSFELINYLDELPVALSTNVNFMKYLIFDDYTNIKYIVYNEKCISRQRELIKMGLDNARSEEFNLKKFLKNDGSLPSVLANNFDFLIYLIENDIANVSYLDERVLDNITISNLKKIVYTVISSLEKNPNYIKELEDNSLLSHILNRDEDFISYIVSLDFDYVRYVDWYNLSDNKRQSFINYFTNLLIKEESTFDIMKYPFHDLFFQNYCFMNYLLDKDFRFISVSKVNSLEENEKLVDKFFDIISYKKYKFRLEDFLYDGVHLNSCLVLNKKMLHYFFVNKVPVVLYIDFFCLENSKIVIENILNEMGSRDFEFCNDDFLVNGKYPVLLSNSERFMRYVIDKNFNHLAYMDISMMDKDALRKIINYAFRMVYYIRGDNRNLNFDIDGYFKGSDILDDEYFKECLESL